jgi:hypothetical protein
MLYDRSGAYGVKPLSSSFRGGTSRFPRTLSTGPLRGPAASRPARNSGLLIFRAAAIAFWLACVVFLLVPAHDSHAKPKPFHGGGQLPAPPPHTHVL